MTTAREPVRAARPGRPRLVPVTTGMPPREQVLDAAAALFVDRGFAATSTRMIAERAGIQQASLYYHFATKDQLLGELLSRSVRPSLDRVGQLRALAPRDEDAAVVLHALAVVDVGTLVRTPHNVGRLYQLPEVQQDRFDAFRAERLGLQHAYGQLGVCAASPAVRDGLGEERLGELLMQLVEVVIPLRQVRRPDAEDTRAIADSCVRLCGVDERGVVAAREQASTLLDRGKGAGPLR